MRVGSTVRSRTVLAGLAATFLIATALAGCAPVTPEPTPEPTRTTAAPSPSSTPRDPELVEGGTARQNLPYFDLVNQQLIAGGGSLSGVAFVDNLTAAGFARENIEITPDNTYVTAADSIMFSVRLGDTCLVGQYGNVGYASAATDLLATGTCLVGTPRPAA